MQKIEKQFVISPHVCPSSNEDGTIILDVKRGVLYSIIGTASLVWSKLSSFPAGATSDDLKASIMKDDASQSEQGVSADIRRVLSEFTEKGIVETHTECTQQTFRRFQMNFTAFVITLARWAVTSLLRVGFPTTAAVLNLLVVDLLLKSAGFAAFHEHVKSWPKANRGSVPIVDVRVICEAVDRATTAYPKSAVCLQRSAVTSCLLRSEGVAAQMIIACRKIPFKAHAWVEVNGKVVNDNPKVHTAYAVVLERL